MKKIRLFLLFLIFTFCLSAQKVPRVEVHKINDQFTKFTFVMSGWYVNALAFDGPDGLVLVDTGIADTAKELKKKLFEIFHKKPKYIINTHEHLDHTGGNAVFGLEPLIISHKNMRKEMVEKFILSEYGPESLPDICFEEDLVLHLNGEEIILKNFTGSHTDSDIIVHFKNAKIVVTGDLIYKKAFPSYSAYAGDLLKYDRVVQKIVAYCPRDVVFINGHTNNSNYKELIDYKNMLDTTFSIVKNAFQNKRDIKSLKNEGIIKKWKEWKKEGYIDTEEWFKDLFYVLNNSGPRKIDITKFLYEAVKKNGLKGFFEEYLRLKESKGSEKYDINYNVFAAFGYYFEKKENDEAAERIYTHGLNNYPKSQYAYIYLIQFYKSRKQNGKALKILKTFLQEFPDSKWGKRKQLEYEKGAF